MKPFKPVRVTVVGDVHAESNQSLRRFTWLAKHVAETQPDYLVYIGDFLSLDSLSAWDSDKRKLMENRRYFDEIKQGNLALDAVDSVNFYSKVVYVEGNHEDRLTRYVNYVPELDGVMSIRKDLKIDERGYTWVPYRDYWEIGGVHFTHIPFGKMREISGKDICSKAELVTTTSVVFGHTHELHTSCVHKHGMKHLQQILNVGCFFEKDAAYSEGKMTNYWRGICELDIYSYGRFDLNTVSMGRLQRLYG